MLPVNIMQVIRPVVAGTVRTELVRHLPANGTLLSTWGQGKCGSGSQSWINLHHDGSVTLATAAGGHRMSSDGYYDGWQVDNIFALDDVIIGKDVVLDTLGLRYKRGSITRLLPFRAHLMIGMDMWNTGYLSLNLDQRNIVGYIPQISLMASRRFGQRTQLGAVASYGGFGVFRLDREACTSSTFHPSCSGLLHGQNARPWTFIRGRIRFLTLKVGPSTSQLHELVATRDRWSI